MLDAATGKSVWASLGKYSTRIVRLDTDQTACVCTAWINRHPYLSFTAVQNSTKGSYRDKRNQVVYSEDLFLG